MRKAISISLLDQALLSAFGLLLNLALVRFAGPVAFGSFTFVMTFILIFSSIQNALTNLPISVLLPARTDAAARTELLTDLISFDLVTRLAMTAVAVAGCLIVEQSPLFLAAAAGAVFTTLGRETLRAISVAEERIDRCLMIDALAVAVSAAGALGLTVVLQPPTAFLAALAAGNLVTVFAFGGTILPQRLPMTEAVKRYRQYWPDTRWSLTGAATTEAEYRLYVFAVQGFRGTAALGEVQAGRLLLGPLNLFAQAWGRVARPRMAAALAAADAGSARDILLKGLGLVLAIAGLYLGALYLAWPWLEPLIYKGRYNDIAIYALAWGLYTVVNVAQICVGILVQSAYRLRELAYVSMGAGIVSATLLLVLATEVHAAYAIVAITCGEIIGLIWLIILAWRTIRAVAAPAMPGARS